MEACALQEDKASNIKITRALSRSSMFPREMVESVRNENGSRPICSCVHEEIIQ